MQILRKHFLALLLLFVGSSVAASQEASTREAWDEEILARFAYLPVQDGGRVKPMDSVAGLELLTVNGKRSLRLEDGKLSHTAWLLDCLFFPEVARTHPCFRVEYDGVLTAIGLPAKGKRDWYSYDELAPARTRLMTEASRHMGVEAKRRTALQRQLIKLAGDMRGFEDLIDSFEGLRHGFSAESALALEGVVAQGSRTPVSDVMRNLGEVLRRRDDPSPAMQAAAERLLSELSLVHQLSGGPALFPPPAGEESPASWLEPRAWWRIPDLMNVASEAVVSGTPAPETHLALLEALEAMVADPDDRTAFAERLGALSDGVRTLAEARGEYDSVPLEVRLNRLAPFTKALVLFLLAFVAMAASWILPRWRVLRWGTWAGAVGATALVAIGVTMRCVIRDRPPVVSLYDTVVFVTGCAVVLGLLVELVSRLRVMLMLSVVLGAIGMFLAGKYELTEVASSGDTMASILAVLDTNYYLAIHVTTIAMGYSGGLLAAAIAHVWILGRLFGLRKGDREYYKELTRMTYGVICFSLLFSLFGTIMGGIWANDSWGRFWGWDPKENGALLICIWQILILHARIGGYVRDRGLAVLAVLGGVVVSASWWGVNLLNVGLHSYGFTSGIAGILFAYWAVEGIVALLAGFEAMIHPGASKRAPESVPLVAEESAHE